MTLKRRTALVSFFLLSTLLLFQNCSNTGQDSQTSFPHSSPTLYFKSTQRIVVEVYYEPGAEPFTGTTLSGMNYWQILEDNLNAIFQYRSSLPVLVVPRALNEMTALPSQGKSSWLGTDILNLNSQYKQAEPSATEARFYLYFLNGYYNSGSGPTSSVIGVSLSGTPIIAIFKDVVESTGHNPSGPVPKYVEQSTLVHEMGHALGFVNNGVPMATSHQDTAHGAHTTNSNCVMYWQNEGASDLSSFVQQYITSGTTVMWGSEVLQDAQNFSQ
ncbi:hypothetical protein [Bdellovibrio bacteriovorus]|uniref:hypothetical protein n=1 Tax=Bdellovibrio TaxID=958 RepID=UPI0035A942C6